MSYQNQEIARIAEELKTRVGELADKKQVLRDPALKSLYDQIKILPPEQRGVFGQEVNQLKRELTEIVNSAQGQSVDLPPLDVTAPWDVNSSEPSFFPTEQGSIHPLMTEIRIATDIYQRMGFVVEESREIDDDYHMFTSLNFPEGIIS